MSQINNGVGVTPAEITLPARGGVQFTAEVTGTTDQRVSWSVNGSNGGSVLVGTISGSGLYTAPDLSPDAPPAQFLVRATSLANSSLFGEATVTVTGRGSQFRSPSVSVRHGNAPDTISSYNSTGVSVMYGASPSNTFPSYASNAISVRYGTPSSNPFPTFLSNAISVQYGTLSANPFSTYLSNAVSVSYGNPPDICTPPPSGMAAWYPGEGNANDIQGSNNGTLQNGATFATGKVGQAFSLDGVDDLITVADAPSLNFGAGSFSFEAWVRANAFNDPFCTIASKRIYSGGTSFTGWWIGRNPSNNWQVRVSVNESFTDANSNSAATTSEFVHLAFVVDRSTNTLKFYVNGILQASQPNVAGFVNLDTSDPLRIGQATAATSNRFNGLIDEVGFYNRALSQTEIQAIYNAGSAGKCPPGSLASLTLNPTTVTGGQTSTGTVTLTSPAPAGGATVNLSSGNTSVATVPASVTIPQGATTGTFTVSTSSRQTDTAVNISASYAGTTRFASLIVLAVAPSPTPTPTPTPSPTPIPIRSDLQIPPTVNAPAQVTTDSSFALSWTVTNNGAGRAVGPWTDKVYLSLDAQPGSDALLAEFPFAGSLDAGQSANRVQTISIPRTIVPQSGNYHLLVVADANNNVDEGANENNNFSARQIQVTKTPRPDLIIAPNSVIAPDTAFFDQTIRVQWQVRNNGDSATDAGEWRDRIYLSLNQIIDGEDTLLGNVQNVSYLSAGEGYVASADVRIPRGVFNNYFIIVSADGDNAVAEDIENNNAGSKALNIQIPPLPDLQVPFVQAPEETFAGSTMSLNWRVENRGSGNTAPDQNAWVDSIYLSQDQTFNSATDRLIGSRTRNGGLTQNEGYTINSFSVELPGDIAGNWYVFVATDAQNRIYEFTNESNNANYDREQPGSPLLIRATPPDLVIPSPINAPNSATAARRITVNWTVRNQGAFDATPRWFDTVYFSDDQTLNPTADTPLATVLRDGTLGPGLEYNASANVTLPACISGTYYLIVAADSRGQIFEYDPTFDAETNNYSQPRALQISAIPPDLRVTAVSNAATGNAGQPVSVSWTVRNFGTGPTIEGAWTDRVYLSPTASFNAATALLAGSFARNGNLEANADYTRTENATVPTTAQGAYYVFVSTDNLDVVEECASDGNNFGLSQTTINVNNDLPDLTVTNVTAPPNVMAGQPVVVQWNDNNGGTVAAQNPAWTDAVYFSTDSVLDGNDRRLAELLVRGPLAIGASLAAQAQVTIPNVAAGSYFLIIRTDNGNHVFEGQREDNNAGSVALPISVPDADLRVSAVNVPETAFSGQEMTISWTVINGGMQQTFAAQWTDYVLLSRDQILDPTDRIIGHLSRNGALDGGASYNASVETAVPAGLAGPYYVFVRADYHNAVAESDEANNTGSANAVTLQLPPPVDLTVTAVNAPATGSPGEAATISYTVQNIGLNATSTARWSDAIYLSTDMQWDINDSLIGRAEHIGLLSPGESYNGTLTAELPAVDPGQYYVIVRADIRNRVRESEEFNNSTTSTGTTALDVPELTLGVPVNSTLRTGQERFYKVNAPADETLLFTLDGTNPLTSNELYARFNQMVSRNSFDFLFSRPYEPDQEVVVPNTQAGTYYSMARAAFVPPGGGGGVTPTDNFSIKAEIVPFSIRSVSPNRIGDNGQVTITIKGAKFENDSTVTLFKNDTELNAAKIWAVDSATLKARFFFNDVPHGVYDVVLTSPSGRTTIANQAVTVEEATSLSALPQGVADLFPIRGRFFRWSGWVTNISNVDIQYLRVGVVLSTQLQLEIDRPTEALPRQNVATESTSAFTLRDVAPGEKHNFSFTVRGYRDPFAYFVVPMPQSKQEYISSLRQNVELLRQAALEQPNLSLPSDLAAALTDPDRWWEVSQGYYVSLGLLDNVDGIGGVNLGSHSRPKNSSLMQPASADSERCIRSCQRTAIIQTTAVIAAAAACIAATGGTGTVGCYAGLDLALAAIAAELERCICECIEEHNLGCDAVQQYTCKILQGNTCPRNAGDPNDKQGPSGYGAQFYIGIQQPLPYTVNFENIPTATAYAQRVRITDQLDPTLDPRTFRLKEIGFGSYRIMVPENRAFFQQRVQLGAEFNNLLADISAGVDIATGRVTWTLTAIDPATGEQPNSATLGLLPPNDETGRGQGFVTYTVQPKANAPTGTIISNNATIIFDTEEPITTNTVTNTLDADAPASAVGALPATSAQTFTISWAGDDPPGGSGLQSYDIWVAENNGPYQFFVSNTTETSAQFTGTQGRTYRFYSIARDNAGNVEAAPTEPDAVTTVGDLPPNPTPTLTGLAPNSAPAGGSQFTLTITGTNFITGSTVHWNNSPRVTAYVSPTQLTATIPAADIANAGTANIIVVNPSPGGGTSNALTFTVSNPGGLDLAIAKTHTGDFTVGMNGVYTLAVSNNGTVPSSGTITVTDALPAGLSFVSAAGAGWMCSATGQNVTCTNAAPLAAGASTSITLTVGVGSAASPGVVNTVNVSHPGDVNPANNTASDPTVVNSNGLQYYPLSTPIRLLDTRSGQPACDAPGTPLVGGAVRTEIARLTCGGVTIPANAQAIVGNATVVNDTTEATGGFVTLYPSNAARPTVSNLNYVAGQIVPNAFTVALGSDGAFNIYATSNINFIVDITGYYAPPGPGGLYYHPLPPQPIRLLDTRPGQPACDAPGTPLAGNAVRTELARLTCNGTTVPASAQVIVGNATVVSDTAGSGGFITLYPTGVTRPTVSNLNYTPGQIVPNAFTVALGSDGAFNIYASTQTNFIVDITGYYSDQATDENGAGLLYYPLSSPVRLLDTRAGQPACDNPGVPLVGGTSRTEAARVTCGGVTIPANAQTIVGNATAVNNTGAGGGFITLYPSGATLPTVSNLNYAPGQVVPNAFTVGLGGDGAFNIFASSSTHFIVDVAGYFAP